MASKINSALSVLCYSSATSETGLNRSIVASHTSSCSAARSAPAQAIQFGLDISRNECLIVATDMTQFNLTYHCLITQDCDMIVMTFTVSHDCRRSAL